MPANLGRRCGEGDPGGVHGVGELLRRVGAQQRPEQWEVFVQRVEDEGDLERVDGAGAR
jgi:hypothetical protein